MLGCRDLRSPRLRSASDRARRRCRRRPARPSEDYAGISRGGLNSRAAPEPNFVSFFSFPQIREAVAAISRVYLLAQIKLNIKHARCGASISLQRQGAVSRAAWKRHDNFASRHCELTIKRSLNPLSLSLSIAAILRADMISQNCFYFRCSSDAPRLRTRRKFI